MSVFPWSILEPAFNAAIAILMAIIERGASGKGQYIDMTLFGSAVSLMHPCTINYMLSDMVPVSTGNTHPNVGPYDKFRIKTVDIFFGCSNDRAFRRLCEVLDRPDLPEDPRYEANSRRVTNKEKLRAELESVLVRRDGEEVCNQLMEIGVPAGPVLDTAQMFEHEHTKHRDMAVSLDWYRMSGIAIKFSRTPGSIRSTLPKFGVHGREVLAEVGFNANELERSRTAVS